MAVSLLYNNDPYIIYVTTLKWEILIARSKCAWETNRMMKDAAQQKWHQDATRPSQHVFFVQGYVQNPQRGLARLCLNYWRRCGRDGHSRRGWRGRWRGHCTGMLRRHRLWDGLGQETIWLVISTPLKNISQLGWLVQIWKNQKCSKPPTSYGRSPGFSLQNTVVCLKLHASSNDNQVGPQTHPHGESWNIIPSLPVLD